MLAGVVLNCSQSIANALEFVIIFLLPLRPIIFCSALILTVLLEEFIDEKFSVNNIIFGKTIDFLMLVALVKKVIQYFQFKLADSVPDFFWLESGGMKSNIEYMLHI